MQDGLLLILRRITDLHAQQEAIKLRLRQGKSSLQLDRILRRDKQEGLRQRYARPFNRYLALGHCLQQRGLRERRCPVYFVNQQNLRENRPLAKDEFVALLIKVADTGNISRQQVGRSLHALEGRAQ